MMPKIVDKPIFFLPVESTPRELDYKLNLARYFCNEGFDVIIGNPPFIRDELKYKNYKGGFLEKGTNPVPDYYIQLKAKGILLYSLSDEGAAYPAHSIDYQLAVDALKTMEHIFLWGDFQKNDLIKRSCDSVLNDKYYTIGYPGFEFSYQKYKMYHKKLKPKSIPEEYILVNTNFGSYNGFTLEETFKACPTMSHSTRKSIEASYKKEHLTFINFYEWLITIINHFSNEIFLIRPHPTEKKSTYEKYFSSFKNVIISKEGNANQVISTAKLVLHNDCTTALQSYLMGVPVVSLANSSLEHISASWPLAFGAQPKSIEEAKVLIEHILKNKCITPELAAVVKEKSSKIISEMFCNLGNSSKNLVSIISSEMKKKWQDFKPYKVIDTRNTLLKVKAFIRRYLPLHYKVPIASRGLLVSFSKNDLENRIKLMEQIDGLQLSYKIKKIYPNAFLISKN